MSRYVTDLQMFGQEVLAERRQEFEFRCVAELCRRCEARAPSGEAGWGFSRLSEECGSLPLVLVSAGLRKPFSLAGYLSNPVKTEAWKVLMRTVDEFGGRRCGILFPSSTGVRVLHTWMKAPFVPRSLRVVRLGDREPSGVVLETWKGLIEAIVASGWSPG